MAPGILASDDDWIKFIWGRIQDITKEESANLSRKTIFDPPFEILPHLYLGNRHHAYDAELLHELGVTHILNCAEGDENVNTNEEFYKGSMVYKGIEAKDRQNYDMTQHVTEAIKFINSAKSSGGKALVHCVQGINRSGFIVLAYCMIENDWKFLKAFEHVAHIRVTVLLNKGFQKQIVQFARENALLYSHKRLASMFGKQKRSNSVREFLLNDLQNEIEDDSEDDLDM